jgi:hypothetical protein
MVDVTAFENSSNNTGQLSQNGGGALLGNQAHTKDKIADYHLCLVD